jgi:hypothetical protein
MLSFFLFLQIKKIHEGKSADTIVITINETNADNCVIRKDIIHNSVAHNYQQI